MYERNAIVLERYFEKIFGFKEKDNLRENYKNYCELIENFEQYNIATIAEEKATEEFEKVSAELAKLQKTQERLYNKSVKLEYSRYILFNNINEIPEEIQKCLEKVENDIEKNNKSLKDLRENFINSVIDYNEKKTTLEKCQKENKRAKKLYETVHSKTIKTFQEISLENVDIAKEFISSENKDKKKELINIFDENGKNERNPFDPDVISNAVNTSIDIYRREIDIYLTAYDKVNKIIEEIDTNSVKLDKHRKFYNDSKAKLHFLQAEKEYIIQFLDNERIAAIYEKKVHRKLMLEACRNFVADLSQIDGLYELILREIAGRSTKKMYKENYNKDYLNEIEQTAVNAQKESSKVKINAVAVMNLNYWRIEGIRRIYEVFDSDISEIYGRDLSEFTPIIENEISEEIVLEEPEEVVEKIVETTKKVKHKSKYGILKSSKQVLANAIYISLQTHEFGNKKSDFKVSEEPVIEEQSSNDEYFDLDAKIAELDDIDNLDNTKQLEKIESNFDTKEDFETVEDNDETEEDSILDLYFSEENDTKKRKEQDERKLENEIVKSKKSNIFKKLININSKSKREA